MYLAYQCDDCDEIFDDPDEDTICEGTDDAWGQTTVLTSYIDKCPQCYSENIQEIVVCPKCMDAAVTEGPLCARCTAAEELAETLADIGTTRVA